MLIVAILAQFHGGLVYITVAFVRPLTVEHLLLLGPA
jgi:hypothetical protein